MIAAEQATQPLNWPAGIALAALFVSIAWVLVVFIRSDRFK